MKKILVALMTLAAILATSTTVWAQSAPSYNLNAVAGTATAALSRVGAVETDLAAAKTEVCVLKADLNTLRHSRGASAGSVRRANEALAAAQAMVAKLEKQVAADDAGVQKHALTTGENIVRVHLSASESSAVTEESAAASIAAGGKTHSAPLIQRCPDGTSPRSSVFVGKSGTMGSYFACDPVIKSIDLTDPATDSGDSYFTSCLSWAAGGAVLGSAVNYGWGYKQDADEVGWEDAAIGAGVGGGGAYVGCLAYHAIKGK